MGRYRVLRGVSVALKDEVLCWEAGDIITDAPKAAIADWLKIGAIEETDAPAPASAPAREEGEDD